MLQRAFVFEIVTESSWEMVGVGAICLAEREVALWTADRGVCLIGMPPHLWAGLERELVSSLPSRALSATSAVARTLSDLLERDAVRVLYLGVFPVEAAEWLPTAHPASAVLNGWRTPAPGAGTRIGATADLSRSLTAAR